MANYDKAKTCVELCRFSYKMYAQTLTFPFDPFFEANPKYTGSMAPSQFNRGSVRQRMMAYMHNEVFGTIVPDIRKFDPIQYDLKTPPNPSKSAIYRGGIDNKYLVFTPRTWDENIKIFNGFDIDGKILKTQNQISNTSGNYTCMYFQGQTGMTVNHPKSGWTSFLGAVIYEPATRTAYIVFRGSRSGDGTRAALKAQFQSSGNPDWVTDMNHLKETEAFNEGYAPSYLSFAAGFWKSYSSSTESMEAAFKEATKGQTVDTVCVTGHSLGGALAQCAYIHLCLPQSNIRHRLNITNSLIECYPISAPPVCMGAKTQHWISRNADASNVHHYYCPYDTVHACELVLDGTEKSLSSVLKNLTHPLTYPYHFGSQIALDSIEKFPNAHEPLVIWQALWGNRPPQGFWQQIEIYAEESSIKVDNVADSITPDEIHQAIQDTYDKELFIERAKQWASNMTDAKKKDVTLESIKSRDMKKLENVKSHTAGCVYHTLQLSIALEQYLNHPFARRRPTLIKFN